MSSESGNGGIVLGMRRGRAVGWIIFGTGWSLIGCLYVLIPIATIWDVLPAIKLLAEHPDPWIPAVMYLVFGLGVIFLGVSVAMTVPKRQLLVDADGVTKVWRELPVTRERKKHMPWANVRFVYTMRTPKGDAPVQIVLADAESFNPVSEGFSDLHLAMPIITRYAPEGVVKRRDFPVEHDGPAESSRADVQVSERVVLQSGSRVAGLIGSVVVLGILAAITVPFLETWDNIYFAFIWLPIKVLTIPLMALYFLSALPLVSVLLYFPGMALVGYAKQLAGEVIRCVVDSDGLTFERRGVLRTRFEKAFIPWQSVQEVYTYKGGHVTIPAEIVFDDGRCIHLRRFFPRAGNALPTILRHVPEEAVRDWYSPCHPFRRAFACPAAGHPNKLWS